MFEYILILIILLIITIILEKAFHIRLYHNLKERLIVTGLFFIFGVLWDTFAIWRGHWLFPQGRNLGIVIGLMPLEEYLFILMLPYFILTVYKIIDSKFKESKNLIN
jgi:lycopene cyclase domain-containing protein